MTASIFYSVAPFNPKTVSRNKNKLLNPDNTIDGILNNLGGRYFKFKNTEEIEIGEYPYKIFSWLSPYLDSIIESPEFQLMTTVELDSTFDALNPYTICIPILIYRNSGIPLGILASITESASLYSLFFESLIELDKQNPHPKFSYYQIFAEKKFLTDEHKSFIKLQKKYNIEIYHCFVHLIRTVGANSLLGFFLSDLLYTFSKEQWDQNLVRMCYTFQNLFKEKSPTCDTTRFDKVSQVLGQDPEGNATEINKAYSPLYLRAENRIPSSTNHIESLHMHINQLTKGSKSLPLRLAIICKYIIDRTARVNQSVIDNLQNYINKLKSKATNTKQKHSCSKCNCAKKFYYSQLFAIDVPCIHDINSKLFDEQLLYQTLKFNSIDFLPLDLNMFQLKTYEIITNMKFKKKHAIIDENNKNTSIFSFIPDYEVEDSTISYIITHTEHQLSSIIKNSNINMAVVSVTLHDEMMNDQELCQTKQSDEPLFWSIYQMRLWRRVFQGKNHIRI